MMALHLTKYGQGLKVSHSHSPVHTLPNTTIASQVGAARDHLHLQKQLGVAAALHQSVAGKRRKQQGLQQQGSMQGPQQGMPQQGPQQQGNMQASQQGQPQGQQQQGQQQGGQQQQGQQQPLSQSLVHVMLVTTQEQV